MWKVCAFVPEVSGTWGHAQSICHVSWSGACVFSARGRWMRSLWVLSNEKLYSHFSLFSRDEWQVFASCGSSPAVAEATVARRRLCTRDSQVLKMLFLGYQILRIALESSSNLGCVPPCLDSNTWGHGLFSRLSRRRAQAFRVMCASWWVTVSRPTVSRPRGLDLRDPHTLSKRVVGYHR